MKISEFILLALSMLIPLSMSCGDGRAQVVVGTPRVLPKATVTPRPSVAPATSVEESEPVGHGPTYYMLYVGMKVDSEPFDDDTLREVVNLALDRESFYRIMDREFKSRESVVQVSIVAPGNSFSTAVQAEEESKAAEILAEAGYDDRLRLTVLVTSSLEWAAREVSRQLLRVGLSVDIEVVEDDNEFLAMLKGGEYTLFLTETWGDLQQPAELLARLLHELGPENYTNYSSRSFAAPFKAGFYRQAEGAAFEYGPSVIPLVRYKSPFLDTHVESQVMSGFTPDDEPKNLGQAPRR